MLSVKDFKVQYKCDDDIDFDIFNESNFEGYLNQLIQNVKSGAESFMLDYVYDHKDYVKVLTDYGIKRFHLNANEIKALNEIDKIFRSRCTSEIGGYEADCNLSDMTMELDNVVASLQRA